MPFFYARKACNRCACGWLYLIDSILNAIFTSGATVSARKKEPATGTLNTTNRQSV
jgi:hypothetical protein